MTIKDMHYDFKKKLNKIDSQQNRNLLVPEIDWTLNEAQELFVKMIAKPRNKSYLGFETSQRTIDDIRTLVVNPEIDPNASIAVVDNLVPLPEEYWHFIKGDVLMDKGKCKNVKARFYPKQQDDEFEEDYLNCSNFEWRVVNGIFVGKKYSPPVISQSTNNTTAPSSYIKLYDDGTFKNTTFKLSYIKRPKYIHNAKDFRGGTYKLPSGKILSGSVNSELPEGTHREIVDIAVLLASGEIQDPNYPIKLQKLKLNNLE